jgi:hypothetical protein
LIFIDRTPEGFATDILSEAGDADLMMDRKSISPDVLSGATMGKTPRPFSKRTESA